jgi:copper(I)-binding protein
MGATALKSSLAAAALISAAFAGEGVQVREARAIASVPGASVAAAYLTIESPSAARLVAASSDAAAFVQIHEMSLREGIMRMRRVETVELPAGQAVRLAPGGTHLMLVGLKRRLRAGESVGLRLELVESGGRAQVLRLEVPVVEGPSPKAAHHD